MNQILNTNKKNNKTKLFFKFQFLISIVLIIFGIIYILKTIKEKERENEISNIISLNAKINSVFYGKEEVNLNNIYFGKIVIDKINLDYYIYNDYTEQNLKVLPCKYSGPSSLDDNGNICIIGHNYYDDRFFSNLNKLEIKDVIIIKNLEEKTYKYVVYKKYEIGEEESQKLIEPIFQRELTLSTCTFDKTKRLVIRAKLAEN